MKYAKYTIFIITLIFLINSVYAADNQTDKLEDSSIIENNNTNTLDNLKNVTEHDRESEIKNTKTIIKTTNTTPKYDNSKYITNTVLNTSTNGSHIIMNVSVNCDRSVEGGYVIYKLNGVTLKDSNGEKIKVYVHNSTAVLNLSTDIYRKVYWSSEAVYSGSSTFNASRSTQNNTINTRITPVIKVTTDKSIYNQGDDVKLNISLSSDKADIFSGIIIFKINGVTLKDSNGDTYILKLYGNSTNMTYQIPLGLKSNNITITTISEGSRYNKVQTNNTIKFTPLDTFMKINNSRLNSDNYFIINATLYDDYYRTLSGKTFVDVLVNGKNLKVNNVTKVYTIYNGTMNIRIPMYLYPYGNYTIQLVTRANNCYKSCSSRNYNISVVKKYPTKLIIDTPKKVRNQSILSLRIYVTYKDDTILKTVNDGSVNVLINDRNYLIKVVNGKAIYSYSVPSKNGVYLINATYLGEGEYKDCSATKNLTVTSSSISEADSSILGDKDPKFNSIPLNNGIPNVVYMTNYVWADENETYTLTATQIKEVLEQDSYSLYLNKHMSKYVAFKTVDELKTYHVLRREKWNVIEKALNKYFVEKNTMEIPEFFTVSLKGKEYTYSETRDIQETSYTCGPTAASVCTQALRKYVNEYTLASEFKTFTYKGTYAKYIPPAMAKYNMTAEYFYKNNFDSKITQLAKGGCSLVFYGVNHYVSIIDVSPDKKKVLVSNSYGNYSMGGGKIPNGWVDVSYMKKRFSSDNFGGLVLTLNYKLTNLTKIQVNNLYNSLGTNWIRQNVNEELNT